jgi:glycosyltransferase involved in cell wall biosynthesis
VLPRVLFVISTLSGGTPQTNQDLMHGLSGFYETWLLHSDSHTITLYHCQSQTQNVLVEQHILQEDVEPITHSSSEYDQVLHQWLSDYDFSIIHIRHIAWHSLGLARLAKEQGAALLFSFHDYYTICPTIKLLDNRNTYCGGKCTSTDGDCTIDLWKNKEALPTLKSKWVMNWRNLINERLLSFCDGFITTHSSVKDLINTYLNVKGKLFSVIPHGRDFSRLGSFEIDLPRDTEPIRVILPGNIGLAKGADIIEELLRIDKERLIEIHLIGKYFRDIPARVVYHGGYDRSNIVELIEGIRPHIGAVLSIWNETWCHTLTECWAAGVPVLALDFFTLRQRILDSNGGWIVEGTNPKAIYSKIIEIRKDACDFRLKRDAVRRLQETDLLKESVNIMALQYRKVYNAHCSDLPPGASLEDHYSLNVQK